MNATKIFRFHLQTSARVLDPHTTTTRTIASIALSGAIGTRSG